jgi:aspartate carbamoyltransferase catalytic subunit
MDEHMAARASMDMDTKLQLFANRGRLIHLIRTQQLSRELLEELFDVAENARRLYTSRLGAAFLKECLPNKRVLLYFVQPSTRTFLSFNAACSILGMSTAQVTSVETSSEMKGESPMDSVHTFAMYHDLIVIRYPEAGFAEECALHFIEHNVPRHIVTGGSGMDQHPTQALLDIYTLHREFYRRGGIDGKRILIAGDLARGRAVRSLIYLLCKYSNVKVDLASPDSLRLKDDMKEYMTRRGVEFRESNSVAQFVAEADAVYMTRIQDEYEHQLSAGSLDYSPYSLTPDVLGTMKATAVILHPLPRRKEIPESVDSDPRSRYWEQVENGMWARVALIAHILEGDLRIKSA